MMINFSQQNNGKNHTNGNNNRKSGKYYTSNRIPWMRKRNNYDDKKSLMERLDQEIKDFVEYIGSTNEEKHMRNCVIEKLRNIVNRIWPEAKVNVYGSFPLDLYLPVSDIDVVVNGCNKYTDGPIYKLADELQKSNSFDQMDVISTAKIPIIKVSEKISRCNVDITFDHNINFEKMQTLVSQYCNEFPELKPLLLILKYVLYQRNLNVPFHGGLGSFALLILLRHFLSYYMGKRGFGPMAKYYREKNELIEEYEPYHEEDENIPNGGSNVHSHEKSSPRSSSNIKKNGMNGYSKPEEKSLLEGFPEPLPKNGSKQRKKNKKKNGVDSIQANQKNQEKEDGMEIAEQSTKHSNGSSHLHNYAKVASHSTHEVRVTKNGVSKHVSHESSNTSKHDQLDSNQKNFEIHQNKQNFQSQDNHQKREEVHNETHQKPHNENENSQNSKKRRLRRPNLGELLVNFFKYFGEFNFVHNGVSADGTFSKEERGYIDQQVPWKLYVDDPITPNNNLGGPTYHVLTIRDFFKDCYDVLTDENANSHTILTRIIILDPHLDKHRAHIRYNFNEKPTHINGSQANHHNNNYNNNKYTNGGFSNPSHKASNPLF